MAVASAHVASTVQGKPSIFDLEAQNDLKELLKPITRNVAQWLYQKYPEYRAILTHPNSLSFVVSLLIESYYLKNYGATFSEAFYGLKRDDGRKTDFGVFVSRTLLSEEVLPFFLNGLNNLSEKLFYESLSGRRKELANIFIKLNTTVQIAFQLGNFVQKLRYITGQTDYHSLLILLSGSKLTYAEPVQDAFSWRNFLPTAIQRSFEISVFLLQCYHWWQTESHGVLGQLPSPPPPEPNHDSDRFAGVCPLCREPPKIGTVLSVSGFVFCFVCIQQHLTTNQKCPVTQFPATINDLIRIYPEDA